MIRLRKLGGRVSPDGWAMIAIVGIVVVAHLLELLDFSDPNPLGPLSNLADSIAPGFVGSSSTIDPNIGYSSQALGHRAMLDLVHLHLPWWNPFDGTGAPLAGEFQSASLFPPTLLLLLGNGQLYEHMLLEILSGIATYRLLRRIGLTRWPSLAGGVAFALNGTFAWLGHATVNPIAFLPLLLLGIEHAYAASAAGRDGGWWLIALSGALSLYAGFPELAYIDALLAGLWLIWRIGCLKDRTRALHLGVKAGVGAMVGTLLAAPLLIAGLTFLAQADLGPHASGLLGGDRLGSDALPQLLMPYVYGPIFAYNDPHGLLSGLWGAVGGYLSISLVVFATLGLCSRGRRGLRIVLGLWVALAFTRIYGQLPGLGDVLGVLPDMGNVAFFRYGNASLELAVIVLAALGLEDLVRAPGHRWRLVAATGGWLVVAGLALWLAHPLADKLGPRFSGRHYFEAAAAWAVAMLILAAVIGVRVRDPRIRNPLLALLVAADALAMFAVPVLGAPRAVTIDAAPVRFLQRHLGAQRFFTLGPLQPNYGSYFGIASLNNNDLPLKRFARYVTAHLDAHVDPTVFVGNLGGARSLFAPSPEQELLDHLAGYRAAGVAYVLTTARQPLPESPSTFTLAARTPTTWIYRLAGSAPFFSAAGCAASRIAVASVSLTCAAPATLVRRETNLSGWSAALDGNPTPIRPADGLFEAVTVPAGTHTLSFAYAPPGILWGWLGFAAGLLALAYSSISNHRRPPPVRRLGSG